ncbi:hypothetical protein SAMN05518672_108210 [Chitinophaga sp. CF118]|uniref:hypothetical protein n=1 Tax=Chitinophaga sp. CF118 TaxID=1884367 RepID=UPI0008F41457|nr:hypothetical protein [Chitinophaga sp. CF118]SFE64168.1 hypothetical protein SAMN05518672_108210 [Chitinophaga sp. CF118]
MSSHYSIIFASLRKVTQEKISLGLILFDDDIVYCKFSRKKLNALRHLLSKDDYKVIFDSISILEKKFSQSSKVVLHNSQQLFKVEDFSFSIDYISYLSRYKNNLVTYLLPKPISIEATEENTLKLFDNLIGAELPPEYGIKKLSPFDLLNERFDGRIQNHFIINHTITYRDVPGLLVPVKVDLIGKNGIDVFVQSIDMTSNQSQIINEISTFYLLKDTYKRNKKDCKNFILSQEPPKEYKKQHEIWNQLVDSDEFNYVDVTESEKIMEYAEINNVKPIFGSIDQSDINELPF